MARLPINRPVNLAPDLTQTTFENVDLNLHDLYQHCRETGAIVGRTFIGCRIDGPAIVLIGGGTTFDETNFGDPRGGMTNLLLQPMGDKALGTVPMHDCTFIGCEFYNVGFTGAKDILEQLAAVPTVAGPNAGPAA
ncbi:MULTISPECIES: hypothetical protein [unclassified Brevundimonas]|uniref:hypothetical protein n=1 Tax=unclassified Brevundimonas TaxID=2622653 RepID=UPI000E9D0B1F|nr:MULTISPECIES: hypothetical protein [unclassified Brevundimonas]HBI20270.1 hypothetical protein [Brevundimonas sp.]